MKKKIIMIGIAVLFAALLIGTNCILMFVVTPRNVEKQVNSLVEQRLAELSSSSPVVDSNPGYTSSDNSSKENSYQDFTPSKPSTSNSTDSSSNPEPAKVTATISNTEKANSKKNFSSLEVFNSENEAFDNATNLPSGRYVSINFTSNVEVKEISSEVSIFNPETEEFEYFADSDFETSAGSQQQVNFKIPDNPHNVEYHSDSINCIVVVTIVTDGGNFYVGCSY